ncbi:MAG: Asp-tRNA(Asn)/Glu-tRNA(Gln) amidotransferase subunit GatB [Nanoarchaeota archaeon]|nr:Asp-tRNA(Asn)/Glu-tRNA(Gln) amidotransferase subunit GatB [Nanoarchaeota archaeon]
MVEKSFPLKIGLEIHGYLNTKEKLFCKCKAISEKDEKPNTRICPICTGQPGSKPMLPNKEAMKKLIQISLILGCRVNHDKRLVWQRKHYSWPDIPKGYQNTISGAYSTPCSEDGKFHGIKITETHLEEDPARWNPDTGKIDYNRSGLPLIEIVTEPDFRSADNVIEWLKNLVIALSYIKAIKKSAGIKVDVNVSTYGERVEIKNINSLDKIKRAIEYEIKRQLENYRNKIEQKRETLTYDESKGKTIKMREKEGAEDYRFIPEPDLPVVKIDEKEVSKLKQNLPETPDEKLNKLLTKYKIDKANAEILTKNLELVDFFEALAKQVDAKKYISWVTIELLRILNYNKKTLEEVNINPEHLAELIKAIDKKEITELKAKQIMNEFIPNSFSIKQKSDISKISDSSEIENFCKDAIKKNPKAAEDFKAGKQESLNFLIGEVMKLSSRRADYQTTKNCLLKFLK